MEVGEEVIFQLITHSGSARSFIFEAFQMCKEGKYAEADEALKSAREMLNEAHKVQTLLIQQEAGGDNIQVRLLMVHAQDHLMTCILARDIMENVIKMQKEINELKAK
ncbi:MAG: PTS lactose/cellobiose transporter subunit IIA [Pelosinus sp.]|nr:PTS lactose/cellobiose transporter subunit IIA [Pelosinus sp.]